MLKRDFLFEHKVTFFISVFIQVIFLLLNLVIPEKIAHVYQIIYLVTLATLLFYPMMFFKSIAPRIGEYFNAYYITASLPFSKKQLMWMGLKPWVMIAPVYIFVTTAMMTYFRTQAFNHQFLELFIGGLILDLIVILLIGGFNLQLITSQILYLNHRYSWLKVAGLLILINYLYIAVVGVILYTMKIEVNQIHCLLVIGLIYFLLNLGAFMKHLKKIEAIYQ